MTAAAPGTGAYDWWPASERITWSPDLAALFGIPARTGDGPDFLVQVHPADRDRVRRETAQILAAGAPYSRRFRILHADGTERVLLDRGRVRTRHDGPPVMLSGLLIDVTDLLAAPPAPASAGGGGPAKAPETGPPPGLAGFRFYGFEIGPDTASWADQALNETGAAAGDIAPGAVLHPDDRVRVAREMDAALRRPGTYDLEYRLTAPDGEVTWVRDRGETFGAAEPGARRARSVRGFLNDITDRKTAEAALRDANAVLEALFAAAPVGLGVWDADFRFVRVNDRLAQMNGLSVADHLGRRPDEILGDIDALDALYDQWRRILATGEPWLDVEITGTTPGSPGPRIWNEHFFPILVDGKPTGIAAVVEDITERRRAEDALRDSATQLRRILDGNVGFVGILEPDGTVLEANATALDTAGITRDEVVGRKFWDAYWWTHDPAVADRLRTAVAEAAAGSSVRYDAVVRMKDGVLITIDFLLSPVRDDAGRVTHLIPSGFDVTERERALTHVRTLMQEVNHRSKNVLALVQAIARQTARSTPEDFIARFSDRIASLARAQDLLVQGNWDSVDLATLVRNQLAHFGDLLDRRVLVDGPPVTIAAQPAQGLAMVLHELATNAGKYGALSTPHGEVRISWSLADGADGRPRLAMSWTEAGGPPVAPPARSGFGSMLTQSLVTANFGVTPELRYDPDGLKWGFADAADVVLPPRRGA